MSNLLSKKNNPGHDGRFRNLEMVNFHYTTGIENSKNPSEKIKKAIVLEEDDKGNLIVFLKTLTDEEFLKDTRFSYPR